MRKYLMIIGIGVLSSCATHLPEFQEVESIGVGNHRVSGGVFGGVPMAELKKNKVKLSIEKGAEWHTYFNKKKTEANALQSEIDHLYKQIDQMVYELYGLSEEEIGIVEQAS